MSPAAGRVRSDTGNFALVPVWLLEAGVSARALQLYAILAGVYADYETGEAFPSWATLARWMRVSSRNTVRAALTELVDAGAVEVVHRDNAEGDPDSNLYIVHRVPPTPEPVAGDPVSGLTGVGQSDDPPLGQDVDRGVGQSADPDLDPRDPDPPEPQPPRVSEPVSRPPPAPSRRPEPPPHRPGHPTGRVIVPSEGPVADRLFELYRALSHREGYSDQARLDAGRLLDEGVLVADLEAALTAVRAWQPPPRNPWAAFVSAVGTAMGRRELAAGAPPAEEELAGLPPDDLVASARAAGGDERDWRATLGLRGPNPHDPPAES